MQRGKGLGIGAGNVEREGSEWGCREGGRYL